jgi:NAD+ synthase
VHAHYGLLILPHRLRIAKLREYAARHQLLLLIAANLTEASLAYFVEGGIDDPRMGNCAPLSELYKSQVIRVAQFMGLPEQLLQQRPSPGFGGIYDEEIIGPYELADLVLTGLRLGYSDAEITQALRSPPCQEKERGSSVKNASCGIGYVRFIRRLVQLNMQKEHSLTRNRQPGKTA